MRLKVLCLTLFLVSCASAAVSNRGAALNRLGVTETGTAYDGPFVVSVQCEDAQGDALTVSKLLLGKARGEIIKLHCGNKPAAFTQKETTINSTDACVSCLKFTIPTAAIRCRAEP